jgi:signal peptidase I
MRRSRVPARPETSAQVARRVVLGVVLVLTFFSLFRAFVVEPYYIPSGSMEPTLQINDRILTNKFIYFFREPRRGDIVIFRSPPTADPDQKVFFKRVVGLPGDRLAVHDGKLYRNGQAAPEPYLTQRIDYDWPNPGADFVVPVKTVFVLGDNRNASNDSHIWGPLPRKNLLGRAFCIFRPLWRARVLR